MAGKVLVTGGTGYIGSHTVVELQKEGYKVIIIDNLSNSDISVLDGITDITGVRPLFGEIDLCDSKELESFITSNQGIDAIIHFAAHKAVGESVQNPIKYYRNNLVSMVNVLDIMKRFTISSLVFSSSCTVYGQPDKLPVTEDAPVQPAISPYGNSKQIGEEFISDLMKVSPELKAISLRYFNPVGAHPSGSIGELPIGVPENLVPYITQTAAGVRESLKVFGDDYNTPDGSCIRDYLHVVDLAKAHVVSLERLLSGANRNNYEVFNLGTGIGVSVLEAIKTFKEATGIEINYTVTSRREGDIEKIWADPSLANSELKWKTELSLKDAMSSAWKWECRNRGINQI
jgi:UDP-glucose 4-epimerase